jgi:hypothetical protein
MDPLTLQLSRRWEMTNRRFHGSSTLIAGMLLTATACGYASGTVPDTWRAQDIEGAVHLNVTNRSNGPMEIHAAGRGTSYRIGRVLPGLTGHFIVRPTMIANGPVEFAARSDDRSPWIQSGQFLLVPGNVVDFELAATSALSIATVRPCAPC